LSIAEQRAVGFILAWSLAFLHNTNKDHEQDREELQELKWQRLEHYSVQYPIPKGHAGAVNTGYRGVPVLPIKQCNVVIENLWSYFFPGIKRYEHIKPLLPKKMAYGFLINEVRLKPLVAQGLYSESDMFIANAISKFYSPYNEDFSKQYT